MTVQSPPQQKSAQHHTRSGTWLYPLARRIHFYAGILIAPFILVAALSGALYALAPQLEKVVYSQQLTAPISDHRISLDAQVKAAQSYLGKDTQPLEVRPGLAPGTTTRVMFADETLGESESRAVFIDPANGQVRGDLTVYGSSGSLPLRTWISQLHKNLHLGEVGRIYSELAASWLWLIAAFGLCMVIIKARRTKKLKGLAYPSNTARGYRTTLSWHTSAGVWLAVGLYSSSLPRGSPGPTTLAAIFLTCEKPLAGRPPASPRPWKQPPRAAMPTPTTASIPATDTHSRTGRPLSLMTLC